MRKTVEYSAVGFNNLSHIKPLWGFCILHKAKHMTGCSKRLNAEILKPGYARSMP